MHCATINKYTFIYLFPYGLFDVQVKVIFLNIIYEQDSIAACPNPPTEHIRSYTRDLQAAQWRRHTVVTEWGHVMDSREHINELSVFFKCREFVRPTKPPAATFTVRSFMNWKSMNKAIVAYLKHAAIQLYKLINTSFIIQYSVWRQVQSLL